MKSLDPKYLNRLTLTPSQASTMRHLGEARGKQELFARQSPEVLESLRTVAQIESTDASNRIEGIVALPSRLKSLMQHQTEPRNRNEREIAGYRDALELIHEARTDMPFSTATTLQLHTIIYRYEAEDGGRWKPIDNEIVERNEAGEIIRVRFRPVSAVVTPQAMEDLVTLYQEGAQKELDPLLTVPLAILDFLCIHPFRDGNGRAARLLTLLLLYHAGYEVGRYISLERIIQESGETYYEALEASSAGWHEGHHEAMHWVEYFWGVLIRGYAEFEDRVGTITTRRGSKSDRVRDAIVKKTLPFSIADLEKDCPGVSRETIRVVLRKMKAEGRIRLLGRGRGARWRVK